MYAIIKTGGKQYRVQAGDKLKIEKVDQNVGDEVIIEDVLMTVDEDGEGRNVAVGNPFLEGVKVKAKVIDEGRSSKVKILKFKRRKHSMKSMGHRQSYTEVQIDSIS
jgi:large subunit ribosomal protein L21